MSDSYSKWCEEQEELDRVFSMRAFEDVKKTSKFKSALCRAKKLLEETEVLHAKRCGNCKHCVDAHFPSDHYVASCAKLGISLINENWVCRRWESCNNAARRPIVGLKANPDMIRFKIIQKENQAK